MTRGWPAAIFARNAPTKSRMIARARFEPQLFERRALLGGADFFALDRDDAVENVAHESRMPIAAIA